MAQDIVGSRMPSSVAAQLKAPADHTKTGYGANGYSGASSDTESNPTQSAMAADFSCDLAAAHDNDWQKRDVGTSSLKAANKGASPGAKVPGALVNNQSDPIRKP